MTLFVVLGLESSAMRSRAFQFPIIDRPYRDTLNLKPAPAHGSGRPGNSSNQDEEVKESPLAHDFDASATRPAFGSIGNLFSMRQPFSSATITHTAAQPNTPVGCQVLSLAASMIGLQLGSENTPPASTSSPQDQQASSDQDVHMD